MNLKKLIKEEILKILFEAKYSKPVIMYHGTSDKYFKDILIHGIKPNPKERTWDKDDDMGMSNFSRESIGGSYWTTNFMTAYSSAGRTVDKHGRKNHSRIIIVAEINPYSAFADEDSITFSIKRAFHNTLNNVENFAWRYKAIFDTDNHAYESSKKLFFETLWSDLRAESGASKHTDHDIELFGELFDILLERYMTWMVRNDKNGFKHWKYQYLDYNKESELPTVRQPEEVEKSLQNLLNLITIRFKRIAVKHIENDHFNSTLRTQYPVKFSGANRIIAIYKVPTLGEKNIILLYGKNIPKFAEDFRQSIGSGMIWEKGKIIQEI